MKDSLSSTMQPPQLLILLLLLLTCSLFTLELWNWKRIPWVQRCDRHSMFPLFPLFLLLILLLLTYLSCGVQRCDQYSMFPASSILLLLPLGRKGLDLHTSLPPPALRSSHVLAVKPGFLKTQINWNLILLKHTKLTEKQLLPNLHLWNTLRFWCKISSF